MWPPCCHRASLHVRLVGGAASNQDGLRAGLVEMGDALARAGALVQGCVWRTGDRHTRPFPSLQSLGWSEMPARRDPLGDVVLQPGTDVWTLSTLLASKHAELAALGELVDVGPCVRVSLHDSSIRRLEEAIEEYLPPLSPHSSLVP